MKKNSVKSYFFVSIIWVFCGCVANLPKIQTLPLASSEQEIIYYAKEKVFPSVVFIKPIKEEYAYGEKQKQQVYGSAVIINTEGYVVTNYHVVERAVEIKCTLSNKEEIKAEVIGIDPETDLAVLKLLIDALKDKSAVIPAEFGDSRKLTEGDLVMAMGAPHGLARSITRGIISSTERYFEFMPYTTLLQTDAAINPGNSGGPLVNEDGKVIGINAYSVSFSENIGFAIPSGTVTEVMRKLIEDKKRKEKMGVKEPGRIKRAWLGITLQALKDFKKTEHLNIKRGVLVGSVEDESPAENCGLKTGDIIISCNGVELDGMYEPDLIKVANYFSNLPIDKPVKLVYKTALGIKQTEIIPTTKQKHIGKDSDCKKWGMTVKEISKFRNPELYFYKNKGVFIQGRKRGGNAYRSGFQADDIILKIGGFEIDDLESVSQVYEKYTKLPKGKRKIVFKIMRFGYIEYLVLYFELDPDEIENE